MFGPRRGLTIEQQVAVGKAAEGVGLVIERSVALHPLDENASADLDTDPERVDDRLARGSAKLCELGLLRPILDRLFWVSRLPLSLSHTINDGDTDGLSPRLLIVPASFRH